MTARVQTLPGAGPPIQRYRQPSGVFYLAAVEIWERFSFYGLQALLVFYLARHFLFDPAEAVLIFSNYAALASLTLIFGGMIADSLIGSRRAVLLGVILLVLGHGAMAFEGEAARSIVNPVTGAASIARDEFALQTLFVALSFVAVGVGLIKSSAAALLGKLYSEDDPRRDAGFTVYYVGISIGAALAPFVCGYLGETFGWAYGFGAAAIGMVIGAIVFLAGHRHYADADARDPAARTFNLRPARGWMVAAALTLASILITWLLIQNGTVLGAISLVLGALLFGILARRYRASSDPGMRARIIAIVVLLLFSIVFWTMFRMMGGVLNLFADQFVDRRLGGDVIPASTLQGLQPAFLIAISPAFAYLWVRLAARGRAPNAFTKIGAGIALTGLSFLLLLLGGLTASPAGVALAWLVLFYLVFAIADVNVIPIGLSELSKIGPSMGAFLAAAWFFTSTFGILLSGWIGSLILGGVPAGEAIGNPAILDNYLRAFGGLALFGAAAGAVLMRFGRPLARMASARTATT